jgi:hypothetical protein
MLPAPLFAAVSTMTWPTDATVFPIPNKVAMFVSTVAAGVGIGVGVGFLAMLLDTPPQPENASRAKVKRMEAQVWKSNVEQRGMQNSFRGTTQLLI